MLLIERPHKQKASADLELTLEEYLALPDDTRCEIVDGVVRPMTRGNALHQEVQRILTNKLVDQRPPDLMVFFERVLVLDKEPPLARIPDVMLVRAKPGQVRTNSSAVEDTVLVVEIVSRGSRTEDRQLKPVQYAQHGIGNFWLIELEPEISVRMSRLELGVYHLIAKFGPGERITDPAMPWLDIEVDTLLGQFR